MGSLLLDRPLTDICQILETDNEEARRLRENSPFAGVLSLKVSIRQRHAKIAVVSNV